MYPKKDTQQWYSGLGSSTFITQEVVGFSIARVYMLSGIISTPTAMVYCVLALLSTESRAHLIQTIETGRLLGVPSKASLTMHPS